MGVPFGGCGTHAPIDRGCGTHAPRAGRDRSGVGAHMPRYAGVGAHAPHARPAIRARKRNLPGKAIMDKSRNRPACPPRRFVLEAAYPL
jgi:hypothetical protein